MRKTMEERKGDCGKYGFMDSRCVEWLMPYVGKKRKKGDE